MNNMPMDEEDDTLDISALAAENNTNKPRQRDHDYVAGYRRSQVAFEKKRARLKKEEAWRRQVAAAWDKSKKK